MSATIEPRLIALLNDASSESFPVPPSLELQLPPLQDPNVLKASGRPLLLEPDASKRNGKLARAQNTLPQYPSTLLPPLDEEETSYSEPKQNSEMSAATNDRALGGSSPQSLRKILGDDIGTSVRAPSKKRLIVENSKDDFVQLPQPPKKHKAANQVVPPIIIGLFEPPPQTALFPPIASSSFHDSHGRNTLNTVPPRVKGVGHSSKSASTDDSEKSIANKKRDKKDVRARKKWTEEETNNLLLGVHKHGLGNWTDILEDTTFSFNQRSAADLKDRFRTCCPTELRGENGKGKSQTYQSGNDPGNSALQAKQKSSLMVENILIDGDNIGTTGGGSDATPTKPRKTRTHRKKLEDLAQLGIEGPFRKSHRRERRPFSEDEDREILQGYQIHGPAWTRIQRDPRFHLQSRQPTDLRDRFRNKFPEKFRAEEKGSATGKENAVVDKPQSEVSQQMERKGKENSDPNHIATSLHASPPFSQSGTRSSERGKDSFPKEHTALPGAGLSSNVTSSSSRDGLRIQEIISPEHEISKIMPLQNQTSLFSFRDSFGPFSEAPVMESTDGLAFSQSFDWGGSMTATFPGSMGEMDISRLLLDENWVDNPGSAVKEKQSLSDLNNLAPSGTDAPSGPSFYNLLCDPEQIVDLHDSTFG
ncbi:uncharacterized protein BP5553_06666 [Venustampulla echinocandica]|uniref:Myb-like domain-containing protein n=1 Tax=Venustampulla echinocandica TaxID=2656787 RepID=A0A370TKK5_9HELO|nr:uncharacterized protein BP5553_06666 [Venustampulla echinocandica]RDL36054.1 hypothetical protein BP5553_06666 [Venustampulla echinocandica]